MATVPALSLIRRLAMRGSLLALSLVAALAVGCVTTEGGAGLWKTEKPIELAPRQMVCAWQNNVVSVPDTQHGGQPMLGLTGRVYFFGEKLDHPKLSCGALGVSVIDETSGKPVTIDHVEIDPETLKRLAKEDFLGQGYSIFLPLTNYKDHMTKLKLRTAFKAKGAQAPIFSENLVTLDPSNGIVREGNPSMIAPPINRPGVPVGPLGVNPNMAIPTLPAPTPTR